MQQGAVHRWKHYTQAAALAGLMLGLAACSGKGPAGPASPSAKASAATPLAVEVIHTRIASLTSDISAVGTFQAVSSVQVSPKAAGLVVAVPVEIGQFVPEGAVIMQLDTSALEMALRQDEADLAVAQARLGVSASASASQKSREIRDRDTPAVRKAQANLDNARLAWERSRTLYRADLIPQKDLQDDKKALLQAQADLQSQIDQVQSDKATVAVKRVQLQADQLHLRDATVRAPFSGYVASLDVEKGAYVQPGGGGTSGYVKLVTLDPIDCEIRVGENDSKQVRVGQRVEVKASVRTEHSYQGRVLQVAPALDPATRTLKVLARLHNPDKQLKPGLYGNARITLGKTPKVLMVPRMAQITQAGQTGVYVVEESRDGAVVRMRTLRRGRIQGDWVEALESGIKADDLLVVGALDRLYDGAPISVSKTLTDAPAVPPVAP